MASFTALNIEPDDQIDDEVDNTKELQIEEALKLYQAALKLHSQGPSSYPQAALAYTTLFKSDIFKYPESETEFRRIDKNPELEFADTYPLGLDIGAGGTDGAQTLPQILYLAYKNHGQFILDCVKSRLRLEPMPKTALDYQVQAAIDNFALALASDESDTELWRRAARIGVTLGSTRIARYCLEAAVEVDDDPTVAELDPAALEEGFAGEQLKQVLDVLGDDTALSHPIMAPFKRKRMPGFLLKHMDPYPFLPDGKEISAPKVVDESNSSPLNRRIPLIVEERSWRALGVRLCDAWISTLNGVDGLNSSTGLTIEIPPEVEQILADEVIEAPQSTEDQVMKDAPIAESPVADSEAAITTPLTGKSDDQPVEITTTTTTVPLADETRQSSVSLPTRKRSQSAAGIRETPDEDSSTQKRSKRIRNRDTTDGNSVDPAAQYAEQMKVFERADEDAFNLVGGLLQKLGVDDLGTLAELQTALSPEEKSDPAEIIINTVVRDLRDILRSWDDAKASEFINGNAADILGSSVNSANAGLAAFLEHSQSGPQKLSSLPMLSETAGLSELVDKVESSWMPLQDIIWEWVCVIFRSYRTELWQEQLKYVVVRLITFLDMDIFTRVQFELEHSQSSADTQRLEEMVETLFELHVDIYTRITNPNSVVPYETRLTAKERLDRWADLAADVIQSRNASSNDELSLRYLWASVFYATTADDVSRDHKVMLWSDLQSLLEQSGRPVIELQNNAVMLDISVEAAEREVSKLTTMDFFFNLFQTERSEPLAIIETLEPVLDPESACAVPDEDSSGEASDITNNTPAALREMWKFLQTSNTSLTLFLWQRLNEAYGSIGYSTKVFSCNLKSIEIIVGALRSADFAELPTERRHLKLLTWLKALDDLLVKSLTLALNDAAACFEIIDDRHIKSTCSALAQLTRILHTASLFDDEVQVGMKPLPATPAYGQHGTFFNFTNKLRELQVRTWALQYTLIKEAMSQNRELFPTPDNDLADYLALVHYVLGTRKSCKASNKIFLKMMKVEMIRLKHIERWEDYLGQVLFDLYGLRLGVGTYLLADHGCPTEQLDRRTVLNIADQVIVLANRMSMKDLLKHELRATIEKMQTAVGAAKVTPHMLHNVRNCTEYLKTSIRPLDMYKAWKGQVFLDSIPVTTPESPLADKAWYFLLGMINLTKFRSTKRLGPGSQTDDLQFGSSFFRLQLQYTAEHWETWYRLAQCFDFEVEEEVLWSADKINNHRKEVVKMQRSGIHCYIMALSTAMRTADDSFATAEKLSEMYYDFGMRIYSSSREPFGMEVFWTDEFEKHMSGASGMYKKRLHEELSKYRAWRYAAKLFRESLRDRPNQWMTHFMLGKCLWKMFCKADDEWDEKLRATRPSVDDVLRPFINAIKHVPKPKDSRQEPTLEPHYKLVSIVHKLILMRAMEPQAGADLLQQQPFAVRKGEKVNVPDHEAWEPFVLESLRHLRNSDKQHWQHRMIARAASIIYDEAYPDYVQAQAAKVEFRESIFTKTMHIQVWKPEAERPGRHCVYMERYVKYMTRLLWITNDKPSLEALVKRVRKKGNEFFNFEQVWGEACNTYLKMIRRTSNVPASMDDVFKNLPHEEFDVLSDRLTAWTADPAVQHPALEALRESSELKKLNSGLMKSTPIDDLINDAWAVLYTQVAKNIPGPDPASVHAAQVDGPAASPGVLAVRGMGTMSLNNLVMDMNGTQISVPVTIAGSEQRPRKLGISRRDVLKRAELAVSRIPDVPRAIAPAASRPRISEPSPTLTPGNAQPEQKQRSASVSTPRVEETSAQQGSEQAEQDQRRDYQESEPGSVHDSADDESDLSDVPDMDDVDQATIFPNLGRRDDAMGSSGGEEGSTPAEG